MKVFVLVALMFCASTAQAHQYRGCYRPTYRVYQYDAYSAARNSYFRTNYGGAYNPSVLYNPGYNRDRDRYVEPLIIENPYCPVK